MPFRSLSPTAKYPLAGLLVIAWLSLCAYLFWYFELRWTQQYDSHQLANFTLEDAPAPPLGARSGEITIVHFIDPECPCTRFSLPHIAALERRYEPTTQSKRIYTTDKDAPRWLPASPAVAIWDRSGQLAYIGPHSDGVFCGQGDDLVARVMTQLDRGSNPEWWHWEAVGCFCPWSRQEPGI